MMKEVEGVALSYLKQSGCDDHNEQQRQRDSQGEPTLRYYDYCNSSHVLLYSRSSEQGLQPTSGFPENFIIFWFQMLTSSLAVSHFCNPISLPPLFPHLFLSIFCISHITVGTSHPFFGHCGEQVEN